MLQQEIYKALEARGYLAQGLSEREVAARQFAKLYEEMCELAESAVLPHWADGLFNRGATAKRLFVNVTEWRNTTIGVGEDFGKELADVAVVTLFLGELYSRIRQQAGLPAYDVLAAAEQKALDDVKRGT